MIYDSWMKGAQNAAQSAQNAQISNQNTGIGGWFSGDNISGYADAFSTVWDSIQGTSGPDTVVYQTLPAESQENPGTTKWIVLGVLGLFVFVGVLIWLRKK